MARFKSPQFSVHPYHVTARYHNRQPFPGGLDATWKVLSDHLFLTHHFFGLKIHAFVLMPNHFHLLCSTQNIHLGPCFNYFMRETSKALNLLAGIQNQTWGSRYFRCEIPSYNYYLNCYKYIYQNPVRAGLAAKCEDWKFSTLHGLLGNAHIIIPTLDDSLLFSESGLLIPETLAWINRPAEDENIYSIRKALRKRTFKLPQKKDKRSHILESGLL